MDLLAIATEQGMDGVALSRASWFRDLAGLAGVVEVPVVGGRTVWETIAAPTNRLFIVEEPNYFGRFEASPPPPAVVLEISHDLPHGLTGSTVRDARHLAASLTQVPGLRLPHGQPESPWFVASLPSSAESAAQRLTANGFVGCTPLGRDFPEYPGGLRVQVAWPQQENARFCTIVRSGT